MKKNKSHRAGFTMVEMLVVIVIIGILMAILIPGVSKARERARRVKCASNLRELQEAAVNHATDHGRYPAAASSEHLRSGFRIWTKRHHGWVDWYNHNSHEEGTEPQPLAELVTRWWGDWGGKSIRTGSIFKYVKDERIYVCPTFLRHMEHDQDIPESEPTNYRDARRSYVMNAKLDHIKVSSLGSQEGGMSRRLLFADAAYDTTDLNGNSTGAQWGLRDDGSHTPYPESPRNFFRGRDGMLEHEYERIGYYHDNRANVVFLDGHVELKPCDSDPKNRDTTEELCTGIYDDD